MIINIAGSPVAVRVGSLNITNNINARSTASFLVNTPSFIKVGQEVTIFDGATQIFGGHIDSYTKRFLKGGSGFERREYAVTCIDYNQVMDRIKVAEVYVNQTVGYIVGDIVDKYLADDGITLGSVSLSDKVIPQVVFNYVTVSDALLLIQNITGLNWNIGFDKVLTLFLNADNIGNPFTTALNNFYDVDVEETRANYRNTQYVRAGDGTTETQVDETPTPKPDGESKIFKVRFPLANKPSIKVNGSPVSANDIGVLGVDNGKKWYWNKNSKDITQDSAETTLIDTNTITISYQGLKPIIIKSESPSGINERVATEGGSGVYEEIIEAKDIDNKQAALDYAQGLLSRYGVIPQRLSIYTNQMRMPGEICFIEIPELELSGQWLVTECAIADNTVSLEYKIKLASSQDFGTWVEFFRQFKPKDFTIRENEVLVRLEYQEETENYSATVNLKEFEPLACSESIVVSESLFIGGPLQSEVTLND